MGQLIDDKDFELETLQLNDRQCCDLELLLNGGFAPLTGFMGKVDYEHVLSEMRLASGELWPMPITLDVSEAFADTLEVGQRLCLRDSEFYPMAILTVRSKWCPNKQQEAQAVYGTTDESHPGVHYLMHHAQLMYLGGEVELIAMPRHYDFMALRLTPVQLKERWQAMGVTNVVAFQTRNPMHRAHQELTLRAAEQCQAHLLIQPVVGLTKPGDIDYITRVRCYQTLLQQYPQDSTTLSLLPLAMRMAGPREALWHALIRKNYGCTHFIVGRDHAGPGESANGEDFYGPYDAQVLLQQHQDEAGIQMVPFQEMVYVKELQAYQAVGEVAAEHTILRVSGTEFRRRLRDDEEIPHWFSYPKIIAQLRRSYPSREKQGFTVFFTGLSGAGKSTIANALVIRLQELTYRTVTLLDGDVVRTHLSSELGFSKEHRDINIKRIGYVASEIAKHRGIAVCAPIAPYALVRQTVRDLVAESGGFVEVHVATSLAVCEQRDVKGFYKKARAGEISGFTGVDDPYEAPQAPELVIDTEQQSIDQSVQCVLNRLVELGYLKIEHGVQEAFVEQVVDGVA